MNCNDYFACLERLELCTGSETLAMLKHYDQCPDCKRQTKEIAHERENEGDYDKLQTAVLTAEIIRRVRRATTDPEIVN